MGLRIHTVDDQIQLGRELEHEEGERERKPNNQG